MRKANKELAELVSGRDDHLAKVDAIQTKYSELLHEMKRLERDHAKARKRADQLQKERDQSRSEMQKAVTVKHKLESLCRELQKENKRIKVHTPFNQLQYVVVQNSNFTEFRIYRTTIKSMPRKSNRSVKNCRTNLKVLLWTSRAVLKKKMMVAVARLIWKPMNCKKNPYSNSPLV